MDLRQEVITIASVSCDQGCSVSASDLVARCDGCAREIARRLHELAMRLLRGGKKADA